MNGGASPSSRGGGGNAGGVDPLEGRLRQERDRRDPKDGELRLGRPKPEETLVEGRSDSDVQIDRPTWA